MRKLIDTITFQQELHLERSITPVLEKLGMADNTMSLYIDEDGEEGAISWEYMLANGEGDEVGIGLWFNGNVVTDYDGVFSLPTEAISLLQKNGYDTSEVE